VTSRLGTGKSANLFYGVRSFQAMKGLFLVDIFANEFNQLPLLYFSSLLILDFLENQNKLLFLNFSKTNFCSTRQLGET
jgi:hypothetical protein